LARVTDIVAQHTSAFPPWRLVAAVEFAERSERDRLREIPRVRLGPRVREAALRVTASLAGCAHGSIRAQAAAREPYRGPSRGWRVSSKA